MLAHIAPAIASAPDEASVNDVVKINAQKTSGELVSRSSIIRDAVSSGSVKIVPAYYNLDSGKVDFL